MMTFSENNVSKAISRNHINIVGDESKVVTPVVNHDIV